MRRVATAAAAVSLLLLPPPVAAQATEPCPRVVAHRANPNSAPENTVAGIASVPATGAGMVEMDVRWTKSHFPVLMHDETVDRTTPGTGRVRDWYLGDITKLLAQDYAPWRSDPRFASTKVPYAWDFFNEASRQNLDLLLDIVGETPPDADDMVQLAEYVDRFGYVPRTVFMGPEGTVRSMRARQPSWKFALIEYNPSDRIRRVESIQQLGVAAYAVPERDVTPAAVAYWHSAGVQVWTWSSDSPALDVPANWQRLRDAGVDALVTNRPSEAIALLCGTGG